MTRRTLFLSAAAAPFLHAAKKNNKGPEVDLLDHSARVEEGKVMLDGHIKNVSEKPIKKLRVTYEILDSDRNVLTSQKGDIEEEMLAPGDEAAFHGQITFPARSVSYRFGFEDGSGKDLRTGNTGPFPIE